MPEDRDPALPCFQAQITGMHDAQQCDQRCREGANPLCQSFPASCSHRLSDSEPHQPYCSQRHWLRRATACKAFVCHCIVHTPVLWSQCPLLGLFVVRSTPAVVLKLAGHFLCKKGSAAMERHRPADKCKCTERQKASNIAQAQPPACLLNSTCIHHWTLMTTKRVRRTAMLDH